MKKLLLLLIGLASLPGFAGLVVYTNPDAYRDDAVVYFHKGNPRTLVFYVFSDDGKTTLENATLELKLPPSVTIAQYGILNDAPGFLSPNKLYSASGNKLKLEDKKDLRRYQPSKWTIYCNYQLYLYCDIAPDAPDAFDVPWQLGSAQGTLHFRALPLRTFAKPRHFQVWTCAGNDSHITDAQLWERELKRFKRLGATTIGRVHIAYRRGDTLSNANALAARKFGFELFDSEIMGDLFNTVPKRENLPEDQCMLDFRNRRLQTPSDGIKSNSLRLCPSKLMEKGGSALLRRYADKMADDADKFGFKYFFCDYEKDIYDGCFCPDCRNAFAAYVGKSKDEIAKLPAYELISREPLNFYNFKSFQVGQMHDALRKLVRAKASGAQIGNNSTLWAIGYVTPGLGRGCVMFSEDPRHTDHGLDFHDNDSIKGGLEDVLRNDLYTSFKLKAPIIARTGFFCDINWNYFCVLSRRGWTKEAGQPWSPVLRPELLKLATANNAALGIMGIETQLASDTTDAMIENKLAEALDFIARHETVFRDGKRLYGDEVEVYSDGKISPEFLNLGEKCHWARYYFVGPVQSYGAIQAQRWQHGKNYLAALFNWDLCAVRPARVAFPAVKPGNYAVTVTVDDARYLQKSPSNKSAWSADELQKTGVSLALPAGAIASVTVSPQAEEQLEERPFRAETAATHKRPVRSWGPDRPNDEYFREHIFNRSLRNMSKADPAALKYQIPTFNIHASSWLVPVDRNAGLGKPGGVLTSENVAPGASRSLEINYHHSLAKSCREDTVITLATELLEKPVRLSAKLRGTPSPAQFQLQLRDAKGEYHNYATAADGRAIRWTPEAWSEAVWDLTKPTRSFGGQGGEKGKIDYPITAVSFILIWQDQTAKSGKLFVSDLFHTTSDGSKIKILP